ncbi:MAG: hypothetical protein EXS35_18425 [Pedosphaera sp.]|nr:hypothetical protein [Pedosphaera sp.]
MKRALRILLLILGIVALCAMALVLFLFGKTTAIPPLPNPNGYDEYIKAGNLLDLATGDAYEMEYAALRDYIATNAEPVRLMRLGLSQTCSVPTMEVLTNLSGRWTDLSATKRLAQFWTATGRLAELDGRTNDAAGIYVQGIHFGTAINHGGFLIHALVSYACEAIPSASLLRLVPTLDCENARKLIAELEHIDRNAATWNDIWTSEKMFMRHELRKDLKPARWIEIWKSLPSLKKARSKHDAITARRRLILTELALRCYQSENGQPPRQLDQLVPKYLERVPQDPFTTQPLVYRPDGAKWLLYSIGPDGVEDGGKPVKRLMQTPPNPGDVFFDSR